MSSKRRIYFSSYRVGADAFGRSVVACPREGCGKPAASLERADGAVVYVHTLEVAPGQPGRTRVLVGCVPTPGPAAGPAGLPAAPPAEVLAAQNTEPA